MPTVLRGRLDGSHVEQFVPLPMAGQYLDLARRHAKRSTATVPVKWKRAVWSRTKSAVARLVPELLVFLPEDLDEQRKESALLTLIYAALALEAGANELRDRFVSPDQADDFDWCKGAFKPPQRTPRPVWKWKKLFEARGEHMELDQPPLAPAVELFKNRNAVVHYDIDRSAPRAVFRKDEPQADARGRFVFWSAFDEPAEERPGLIPQILTARAAQAHLDAAEGVVTAWQRSHVHAR